MFQCYLPTVKLCQSLFVVYKKNFHFLYCWWHTYLPLFFEVVNYTEQYHGLLTRAMFTSYLHVQTKISTNRKLNGCKNNRL